jgi:hypothetical protein
MGSGREALLFAQSGIGDDRQSLPTAVKNSGAHSIELGWVGIGSLQGLLGAWGCYFKGLSLLAQCRQKHFDFR